MRVGVLGVGRIGVHHAETLANHADVADLVLTDADTDRAREVAYRLRCRAVSSVDAAFDAGLDAVVVATPTETHPQLIVMVLTPGGNWSSYPPASGRPAPITPGVAKLFTSAAGP